MKQGTGMLARYVPILAWLPNYQGTWLRLDLVAGATAAAVVIPQAMAYASIAGLPVQIGLYTALLPMLIYALLGTSRALSVSTTSTIAILTGTVLATVPADDAVTAAATLALLTGAFLLLGGILRLGFVANFISLPVLTGFKAGIGVVILVGQLPKVLGESGVEGGFLEKVRGIFTQLGDINWPTFAIALLTLAILVFLPRVLPKIPAALVAVLVAILLSAAVDLEALDVRLVDDIPPGLPGFGLPDLGLASGLWLGALAIAVMSFTESIAAGRAFVGHGEPDPDANQELVALGFANMGGSFFQIMPAGGGTSQTAVNNSAGARSQLAAIVTAAVVAVTLLFLAPFISLLPEAALGALVLVAAVGLIKPAEFRAIYQIKREELVWAVAAMAGVVLLGTLEGILLAVIISLLVQLYHANHPPVYILGRKPGTDVFRPLADHPDDETFPGVLLIRAEGALHFAVGPRVSDIVWHDVNEARPRLVIADCSAITDIDYTALMRIISVEEKMRAQGITLWLAGLDPEPLQTVRRSPLGATLGKGRMFPNLEQAVEAVQNQRLDDESAEEGESEAT